MTTSHELLANNSPCDDWESYKDEKCFKIFDNVGLQNYEIAEKICKLENSSLMIIRFQDEQDFISNYLKTRKVEDNVWIGINHTNWKYKWDDGSDLVYTNWAHGNPKNKSDHCAQLQSDEDSFGKWSDVLCDKKNLVVCQKIQIWSLLQLQNIVLSSIKNLFPVGFIYVQLPNEKTPTELWPWMVWQDISLYYAGVFFRVTGGEAASFGQVQQENSPRLVHVNRTEQGSSCSEATVLSNGQQTCIIDADHTLKSDRGIQFTVSGGEVRPRNMAIRIWKRTG